MTSNNSSLPRLLRSASNASASLLPESRPPRSSAQSQTTPSETSQQPAPPVTRSRFGFAPSASNPPGHSTHIPNETTPKDHDTNHKLPARATRPSSALGRPASSLARPSSALCRPSTALGTRSQSTCQPGSRLPQSAAAIPAPTRKRRTSSLSSQRPARSPAHHANDSTSSTGPKARSAPHSDLEKQLAEALDKLSSVQEECDRFRLLSEEVTLQANQSEAHRNDHFSQEISRLQEVHREKMEEIQKDLGDQLRHSRQQMEHLQSSSSTRSEELDRATAQVSQLHSEIEQMDIDSGLNAAQVIELTRVKTELEAKLEAAQQELHGTNQENQKRIEQVTQHYHHIQSKLHQDLEQITADYQACLQQQSLTPSAEIAKLNSRVHLLEQELCSSDAEYQKVRSELDRLIELTARHEDEKRSWELVRHNMQEELRGLELQTEMVKRRKITSIKTENDSSIVENQLIDFSMTIGDFEGETLHGDAAGRSAKSTHKADPQDCPNDSLSSIPAGRDDDSLIMGPSSFPKLDAKPENEQSDEPTPTREKESSCGQNESENLAQFNALQIELTSLKAELHTAHDMMAQLEEGHRVAQMSSEHELNSARKDLEHHLDSSNRMIEALKSHTVGREIHENVQNDLKNLQSQLSDLSAQLVSSQESICTLNTNISTMEAAHDHELDRLSDVHAKEIQSCAEQIVSLKAEFNDINRLYAQTSSKLEHLAGFSPERVSVLTSRLRSERDEARNAMTFLHVEQKAIEEAGQKTIHELQMKQQDALNETASERTGLVMTIAMLYRNLQSWKQTLSPAKTSENNLAEQYQETKPVGMDDSLVNFNNVLFNCSFGNDDENMLKGSLGFESHFGNETNAQAYATALDQITTLTQQVQDLKEQLLHTYVAHQEQETQILAELENSQQNTALLEEQHAQFEKQQADVILSLELKFSGIRHQFESLELSYTSVREEKLELQIALEKEREKLEQSELEKEALQSNIDHLRRQIHSTEASIEAQEEQMSALKGQLSLAHQAPDLSTQVEQLSHDLQEQKKVIETLEEKLEAATSLQRDRLTAIEELEGKLKTNEVDQRAELEKKNTEVILLKEEFEKQASHLSDSLEQKSALIVRLEGTVDDLSAEMQEAHNNHGHTQAATDEKHQLLENRLEDLLQKAQVMEREREILTHDLRTSSQEHEAFKDRLSSELGQTQEELTKAMGSKDLMSQRLNELQGALEQEREHFKQSQLVIDTLQSTIDSHGSQIQSMQATIELGQKDAQDLNRQLCIAQQSLAENQSSDFPTQVEQFTRSLEEQKELIRNLEEQLGEAHSLQQDHLIAIERLEEALRLEETERRNESERKKTEVALLTEGFERKSSHLSSLIDEKSAFIAHLQEEVVNLTAGIQEAQQNHQQIQGKLESALAELIQERKVMDEEHRILEIREAELYEKMQASELEREHLIQQLDATLVEHQAFKDKILQELGQTKEELVEVSESKDSISREFDLINEKVEVLTEELVLVRSQQSTGGKSGEAYETLSSEFQALKQQLSTVTDELESLRSQYLDMTSKKEDLTTEVKEKDLMIDSLKADLATVSKLHTRLSTSSDTTTERIQELETRIESKSAEAEDAMDRLLDEMQKNKRLSILLETLKVKLKSKTKVAAPLDEPVARSGDDAMRATTSSLTTTEESNGTSTGSNIRKRKHEPTGQSSRLRAEMGDDDSNTNKENPSSNSGRRSVRRKVSPSIKPTVLITEPEQDDEKLEEKLAEVESSHHHLAILQPISVNQPTQTTSTSPQIKNNHLDLKPSDQKAPPPSVKTNSNLLASIQSLRRKQQLKHNASSGHLGSDTKC